MDQVSSSLERQFQKVPDCWFQASKGVFLSVLELLPHAVKAEARNADPAHSAWRPLQPGPHRGPHRLAGGADEVMASGLADRRGVAGSLPVQAGGETPPDLPAS